MNFSPTKSIQETYCLGLCSSVIFFAIIAMTSSHPVIIGWSSINGYLQVASVNIKGEEKTLHRTHIVKMVYYVLRDFANVFTLLFLPLLIGCLEWPDRLTEIVLGAVRESLSQSGRQVYALLFSHELQHFNNLKHME